MIVEPARAHEIEEAIKSLGGGPITPEDTLIDYTNWKGNRRYRIIRPNGMSFSNSIYHPTNEWCIAAVDREDGMRKLFPMTKIHSWHPLRCFRCALTGQPRFGTICHQHKD